MDRNEAARREFLMKNNANVRQVCIGIPSNDEVKANFAMALGAMCLYSGYQGIPCALVNQKGSILPANRNRLVKEAQNINSTHLLQIDSDLTFPPGALQRLLNHKKPIVGATYPRRSPPHDNLAIPLNRAPVQNATGLTAVDRLPTGLLLMDMEVFSKIRMPFFRFPTTEQNDEFPEGSIAGEDYYLCDAAKAAGYEIFLDVELSFQLTHWGECGWRLKDTQPDGPADQPRFEMVELQSTEARSENDRK